MTFKKATKEKAKLRCALIGPAGSGKTYTALRVSTALIPDARILVIDTEKKTAKKYADDFEFFVEELVTYEPLKAVEIIQEADQQGFDVLIVDSLSHFWMGAGGMLDQVDAIAKRKSAQRGGATPNTFEAWKDANPMEKKLWDAILGCNMHVFATLRTKTEYIIEENEKGKKVPRKIGLAPIQRDGLEYEFDVVADLDIDNNLVVGKTRCKALKGYITKEAGEDLAKILSEWLTTGAEPSPEEKSAETSHDVNSEPTNGKTPKQTKDYAKEAAKCKTLDELKNWFIKLPAKEKQLALAAKDKCKAELEKATTVGNGVVKGIPMLDRLLNEITPKTSKEQLMKIDELIDKMEGENKRNYLDEFRRVLDLHKINYEIISIPF